MQRIVETQAQTAGHPKILCGWKNIATYMDMSIRSAQRYELEHALPVRRPSGTSRVIATIPNLDAWVANRPTRTASRATTVTVPLLFEKLQAGFEKMQRLSEEMKQLRQNATLAHTQIKASIDAMKFECGWGSQTQDRIRQLLQIGFTSVDMTDSLNGRRKSDRGDASTAQLPH